MVSIACFSTAFAGSHEAESEAAEEKQRTSGWFQIDVDSLGTYFLIGASHSIGGISIDSKIYVNDTFGEFDIGVPIPAVTGTNLSLIFLSMLGIRFDYTTTDGPDALFPQLFAFLPANKLYFFSWRPFSV